MNSLGIVDVQNQTLLGVRAVGDQLHNLRIQGGAVDPEETYNLFDTPVGVIAFIGSSIQGVKICRVDVAACRRHSQ